MLIPHKFAWFGRPKNERKKSDDMFKRFNFLEFST